MYCCIRVLGCGKIILRTRIYAALFPAPYNCCVAAVDSGDGAGIHLESLAGKQGWHSWQPVPAFYRVTLHA